MKIDPRLAEAEEGVLLTMLASLRGSADRIAVAELRTHPTTRGSVLLPFPPQDRNLFLKTVLTNIAY